MTWFLSNLERLAREHSAIEELETSSVWLRGTRWGLDGSSLFLDAVIFDSGREWPVRLTYPEHFPSALIAVRPQEPGEQWSSHQYFDGTLCLEWGPDNWHPDVNGARMLESAFRLLSGEHAAETEGREPVPSRHALSVGQDVRTHLFRMYLSEPACERLLSAGPDASLEFSLHFRESVLVVIQRIWVNPDAVWENSDIPPVLREEPGSVLIRNAIVRRMPVTLETVDLPPDIATLNALLSEHGLNPAGGGDGEVPVLAGALLVDASGKPFFLYRRLNSDSLVPIAILRPQTPAGARLNPGHEILAERSVGLVGLGSAGSKIATSLARSGVRQFVLVDEDVFLPENVVRNALDLCDTAEHKADAVSAAIRRIAPQAEVEARRVHLTGQESNAVVNGVLRQLAFCDLLIDATADPRVFNLLAATSGSANRPMIWMEVFGGGIGGMIARSRPGADPPAPVVRQSYHEFTAEHPAPDQLPGEPYGIEDEGRILTANDADVSVIAGLASQLALDALSGTEPSAYPHSLYLIGFRRAWVFAAPLQVIPIRTDHIVMPEQPVPDPVTANAGLGFVRELLERREPCE